VGTITLCIEKWKEIGAPNSILRGIQEGFPIKLIAPVIQKNLYYPRFTEKQENWITEKIEDYLKRGNLIRTREKVRLISNFFLVPKPGIKLWRLVVDLRPLNFITRMIKKIKLETLEMFLPYIKKGDFLFTLDLKDFYLHFPIKVEDRDLVSIIWKGEVYIFTTLTFGWKESPYLASKAMRCVITHLRKIGYVISNYLDDFIGIVGNEIEENALMNANKKISNLVLILKDLGFEIQDSKSQLKPLQSIVYLGLIIDTRQLKVLVPNYKLKDLYSKMAIVLKEEKLNRRFLAKIAGKLNAITLGFIPAKWCARPFHECVGRKLKKEDMDYFFLERRGHNISRGKGSSKVFHGKRKILEWKNFYDRRNIYHYRNRFFSRPLWRSFKFRNNNTRCLEKRIYGKTHKLEGIDGSFDCNNGMAGNSKESKNSNKNRQSSSLLLFKKSWRKNKRTQSVNKKDTLDLFSKQHSDSKNYLGSFRRKLFSRSSFKRYRSTRMGIRSKNFQLNRKKIGKNGYRSFCSRLEPQTTKIQRFKSIKRKESRSNRLFYSKLEGSNELRECSIQSDSESFKIDKTTKSKHNNDNSQLEQSTLVQNGNGIEERNDRIGIITAELLFDEKRNSSRTIEESKMEIPGNKDNILNESIQIIRNSWSESTRKTYFDIWKKFTIFAKINKFNIYPPDLFSIMSFMISLSKTAPSSVKTFIAVLSVINNLNGWVSPYKFDAIKRLIKAIEKKEKKKKESTTIPFKDINISFRK